MAVERVLLANIASAMSHLSGAASRPAAIPRIPQCALSIVVGSVNSARSITRSLAALERASRGLDAEIVVVDASTDETIKKIQETRAAVRLRQMPSGTLTPVLWSVGLAMSRGRVVAFSTGHCVVEDTWARALLDGIESGATGVAGSLSPSPDSDSMDWAVFYLRYSAFLDTERRDVAEIPGDNAAYRRDALDRHANSFTAGFWEVDFHRRLRAEDPSARLMFVSGADVQFGPSTSFAAFARHRFAHGRHFGAWRVENGVRSAWQVALAAPVVPFLLVARIARRVLPRPSHRVRFLLALPLTFALAAIWSAGEAWGALSQSSATSVRKPGFAA